MEEIKKYRDYGDDKIEDHLGFLFCPSLPYDRVNLEDGRAEYDEVYNNYKAEIKLELVFKVKKGSTGNILDYVITVPAKWGSNNYPCLRGLTTLGRLNLDLLNSGLSKLRGWRFWNDVKSGYTRIAIIFELYPIGDKDFTNLKIEFWEITSNTQSTTLVDDDLSLSSVLLASPAYTYTNSGKINNGGTTIEINWNLGLKPRTLYKVNLEYLNCDGKSVTVDGLWLLTTELFNNCFDPGDKYVANYCFPETTTEQGIITDKLKIKLKFKDIDKQLSFAQTTEYSTEGSLISTNDKETFTSIQTDKISVLSEKLGLEIENEELYPKYILLKENSDLVKAQLNISNTAEILNPIYNLLDKPLSGDRISDYLYILDTNEGISIVSKEKIRGNRTGANLSNVFVKMSEALPDLLGRTNTLNKYCGVFPDIDYNTDTNIFGGDGKDVHISYIIKSNTENGLIDGGFENPFRGLSSNPETGTIITQDLRLGYLLKYYINGRRHFSINNNESINNEAILPISDINDGFNNFIEGDNVPCTWLYSSEQEHYFYDNATNDNDDRKSNLFPANTNTIIWWRSKTEESGNSSWRACKIVVNKGLIDELSNETNRINLTNMLFGRDFYFCFIKNTSGSTNNLYVPDINTNDKFIFRNSEIELSLPVKLSINKTGNNVVSGLSRGSSVGVTFTLELESDYETNIKCEISHRNNSLSDILNGIGTLSGIDNIKGRSKDSKGNKLELRNIYIERNGELLVVENNPFIITESTFDRSNGDSCRYIYCKEDSIRSKNGKITLRNNLSLPCCIDFNNGDIRIYFRNVPLIPLINET